MMAECMGDKAALCIRISQPHASDWIRAIACDCSLSKWRSYYAKHLHGVCIILGWQPPPRNLIKCTYESMAFCIMGLHINIYRRAQRERAHARHRDELSHCLPMFLAHAGVYSDAGRWMEINPRTPSNRAPAKGDINTITLGEITFRCMRCSLRNCLHRD